MTLEQALDLRVGDHITNKYTAISMEPIPITDLWVNTKRDIVRVRLNKVSKHDWLNALAYDLPEKGKVWCEVHKRWEWAADHRRDHPEYYHAAKRVARPRGAR